MPLMLPLDRLNVEGFGEKLSHPMRIVRRGTGTGWLAGQRYTPSSPCTEYAMWLMWSGESMLVPFQQSGKMMCTARPSSPEWHCGGCSTLEVELPLPHPQ